MRYFRRIIFVPLFLTLAANPIAVQKKVLLVMSGSERTNILKKQMKHFVCKTGISGDNKNGIRQIEDIMKIFLFHNVREILVFFYFILFISLSLP